MIWKRLTKNLCPQCTSRTMLAFADGFLFCRCGFRIAEQRMSEIVSSIVAGDIEREYEL